MNNHPDRFLLKAHHRGECWEWTGSRRKDGYGRYRLDGSTVLAHRASYFYATGVMPEPDVKVCHSCDNHWCVNPEHLFLGTQGDNVADMIAKGRRRQADVAGERNPQAKLTSSQVAEIRASDEVGRTLAIRFGVSASTIYAVRRGDNWSSENASRRAEMRLTA